MAVNPDHSDNLTALRRIEGQIRGVQRMVDQRQYCVDILTQIGAVQGALRRVQERILSTHLEHCVTDAVTGASETERAEKLREIIALLRWLKP